KKNILIIYAPRECPSGSEGQTCGENWPDFIPVFVGLKVEKKNILIIYAPRECPSGSEGQTCGENWV
ncbi:hypothetical protein ACIXNJ_25125, partial [Bacteroides fragilis]